MSLPEDPIVPIDEPAPQSAPTSSAAAVRARRRRAARQQMFPTDAEGQATLIATLSKRAYPSLELFVFSLVSGVIIGLGFLLNAPAVLLLGILVAPLMTPWVGFLLAILTGKPRLLLETLLALGVSEFLVFLGGLVTGFAARAFLPMTLPHVFDLAHLWIPALFVFAIGAVVLAASFARSEDKPVLSSIIIAYAFYLPINASGFGLGSGLEGIWPIGLFVFLVHFALASALGLITLLSLKLRPTATGMVMSVVSLLIFIGLLIWLMSNGISTQSNMISQTLTSLIYPAGGAAVPAQVTAHPTSTNPPPTLIPTTIPSVTRTFTPTPQPSSTPTKTLTPSFTPNGTITPTATESVTFTATKMPSSTASATNTSTSSATATATVTSVITATNTSISPTASVTLAAGKAPTFTPTPNLLLGKVSAEEGGGANLRQTPNGKFIDTLPNGTVVEVQPDTRIVNGVEWAHVFASIRGIHIEGWLLASVIVYDRSATPQASVTPTP